MRKSIFLGLFMLVHPVAFAAEWRKFSETELRSDYIDRSTLARKGKHVRSWSKVAFSAPQVFRGGAADGIQYRSALQFADFNCESRELYVIAVNYFAGLDADGALLHSEKPMPGERPAFTPIAPESVGESWMKQACSAPDRQK